MEPTEHTKKQSKGDELKGKTANENIATNLFLFTLPIIRASYGRAIALDDERDDVADDKDWCKSFAGDAKNAVVGWREDSANETADEEVISCSYEDGCENGECKCQDERDLLV